MASMPIWCRSIVNPGEQPTCRVVPHAEQQAVVHRLLPTTSVGNRTQRRKSSDPVSPHTLYFRSLVEYNFS